MTKRDSQCFKGVAILMMICFHAFSQSGQMGNLSYLLWNETGLYQFSMGCQLCVSILIFISAYGTASQYIIKRLDSPKDIAVYTGFRYIKMMMGYWFVYLFSFFFGLLMNHTQSVYFGGGIKYAVKSIVADFFGMYMNAGTPTLNSSWWFMSMAVSIIFILPVVILFERKLGFFVSLAFLRVTYYTFNFGLGDYHYTVIVGVGLAVNKGLPLLVERFERCKSKKVLALLTSLLGVLAIYYRDVFTENRLLTNPVITVLLLVACIELTRAFPVCEKVLALLGKHSLNMWLVHAFIYYYYFSRIVYMWKYPTVVYLVVVGSSLLVSVALEKLKGLLRWNVCVDWMCRNWEHFIFRTSLLDTTR